MTTAASLSILISAKNTATQVLTGLQGDLQGTSKALESFGSKAASIGGKLSLGLTAPITALGFASFNAASNMAESANKMQIVFGEASGSIAAFAASAATDLGMSRQAATEAAGTFGNMFTSLGLGQQPAADMSTQILRLSADLASFNNLKPEEVLEKLRSGLVGEAEPLRTLGVTINEATVKAKAMELGLADATGQLSESAKVQARYALILEQTRTAQGDFARTSGDVANSTRIAKAQMEDLTAQLGVQLLPIGLQAIKMVSGLVAQFGALSPEVRTGILVTVGLLAILGPITAAVGAVASVIGIVTGLMASSTVATIAHTVASGAQAVVTGVATAAQWLLNAALTANPIGLVVVALAALTAALVLAYRNSETFRNIIDGAFTAVKGVTESAIGGAIGIVEGFLSAINSVIGAIGSLLNWLSKIPGGIGLPSVPSAPAAASPGIPGFASGGRVPGPIGRPMLAVVHGGEVVTPAGRGANGVVWTGNLIVQGIVIAERDLAETVRRELLRIGTRNRTTGVV